MSEVRITWRWNFLASPERLWPALADTNRFNRIIGLPRVEFEPLLVPGKAPRRQARAQYYGVRLVWEEQPFEFEAPRRFSIVRRYSAGPVSEMESQLDLSGNGGGAELTYHVRARLRFAPAAPLVRLYLTKVARSRFDRALRGMEGAAVGPRVEFVEPAALGEEYRSRLEAALRDVEGAGPLVSFLTSAAPLDVWKIRPFALAQRLGIERPRALVLCLAATRLGILDALWMILCPHCRGAKVESDTLAGLRFRSRCDDCNIDFEADFDRLTELAFRLAPRWKPLDIGDYCVGGPQNTPHVRVQFLLEPGQSVSRRLELPQGSYRVRSTAAAAPHFLEVRPGGAPEARFAFGAAHETADAAALPACTLHFHNDSDCEALIAVERTAWADDACSAAYVSTFQEYRDLFGRDVLGPGVAVKISTMALLFTDVKGSTALYERIGDAPAFGLVRTHFDLLTDAVREHGGAVIKTIGDAVMAAFLEPAQAVAAALDMHARVTTLMSDDGQPIVLKIGLHAGPCFAVTMNETLDYFGNVVNLAARIQGLATGGDVVLDSELARRPEVAAVIGGRRTEPFTLELRGFRGARSFVRVLPS